MPSTEDKATANDTILKQVAFYQEMVSGWITTQIEDDKQAMGLSGLAIGVLMTFRKDIETSGAFVLWILAGLFFFAAILLGMRVLYLNAAYVEEVVSEDNDLVEAQVVQQLSRMTNLIYTFFVIGAALIAVLAISTTPYLQHCGGCK